MKSTAHSTLGRQAQVEDGSPACPPRRRFLQSSMVLTGVIASGSLLASLAPSRVWALEAIHLNSAQASSLLSMAKRLYPHEGLSDAAYAMLVKDIDAACEDQATKELVLAGLAQLDREAGGNWSSLDEDAQLRILTGIQETPFFGKIRGQCVVSVYDNPIAYAHFGYEGEVWSKGGYLARGFDSLVWLPEPPRHASPSIYDK